MALDDGIQPGDGRKDTDERRVAAIFSLDLRSLGILVLAGIVFITAAVQLQLGDVAQGALVAPSTLGVMWTERLLRHYGWSGARSRDWGFIAVAVAGCAAVVALFRAFV
jgi:hypothetical protein